MSRFAIRPVPHSRRTPSCPWSTSSPGDRSAALAGVVKWFLIPALMLAGCCWCSEQEPVRCTGLADDRAARRGLLLSWLGDITFANFVVGLAFFLAAQLCYIALFWVGFHRRVSSVVAARDAVARGFLAVALAVSRWHSCRRWWSTDSFWAVMAVSIDPRQPVHRTRRAFFVASDSLLAIQLFTPALGGPASALIMTL